jgi:ribosomal protein L5
MLSGAVPAVSRFRRTVPYFPIKQGIDIGAARMPEPT